MERNGNGPRKLCFGNFTFGNRECMACPDRAGCWDDQAGWGISQLTSDAEGTALIEGQIGEIPDWIFEWDELSEAELSRLKIEEPERAKIYNLLNSGIQDKSIDVD